MLGDFNILHVNWLEYSKRDVIGEAEAFAISGSLTLSQLLGKLGIGKIYSFGI